MLIVASVVAIATVALMFTKSFRAGFETSFSRLLSAYGKVTDFFVRCCWPLLALPQSLSELWYGL